MRSKQDRQTLLPESLRDYPGTVDHSHRFGVPIRVYRDGLSLPTVEEEKPVFEYHKTYHVNQAGDGVIALKDVEYFPAVLIKQRQTPKSWIFQKASHENLVPLTDFLTRSNTLCLIYDYVPLAIPLGCLAGLVHFSEADIATVCREALSALVYIHSELRISHGSVNCSNVLLDMSGTIKLANIGDSMLNGNDLDDSSSDVAAVGFIVMCLTDSATLITGIAPEDIALSGPARRFIENSKTTSAEELLKDEFLELATPGGSWSLKRHYYDAAPLSVQFGHRTHEDLDSGS